MTDRRDSPLSGSMQFGTMPESVECPFCSGMETEQFAGFGSQLSVSQYYCRACRTVFEWMKWRVAGEYGAG